MTCSACVCVCDLGAPNSAGEELVTQNNKALPLQASRWWPPLKVEGSTSYTCQGCDLSPPQHLALSRSFFLPLLSRCLSARYLFPCPAFSPTVNSPPTSFLPIPPNDALSRRRQKFGLGFRYWFINFPFQTLYFQKCIELWFWPGRRPKLHSTAWQNCCLHCLRGIANTQHVMGYAWCFVALSLS